MNQVLSADIGSIAACLGKQHKARHPRKRRFTRPDLLPLPVATRRR